MTSQHASVSIVCVYNNAEVRANCLDRSITELSEQASDVEYIPVDNTDGRFPTAGAALNFGASLSKNEVVVFAHQDVYLHSLTALKQAAGQLCAGDFGIMGAVGMSSGSVLVGRIRDRVMLAGLPVSRPVAVDSLDEVLFMVSREQLKSEPLTESPELAWHAYAVEYGLRMRRRGLLTGVADIPITHNSLSINLARLDSAHSAVAAQYADLLPVITTCGKITRRNFQTNRAVLLSAHRWRYRWLRDSVLLRRSVHGPRDAVRVLSDIRYDIDAVLEQCPGRKLQVINCNNDRTFTSAREPVALHRRDGIVEFTDHAVEDIPVALKACPPDSWVLITNLARGDAEMLGPENLARPCVLGFHRATRAWLLLGPTAEEMPTRWRSSRTIPLGAKV